LFFNGAREGFRALIAVQALHYTRTAQRAAKG